MPLQSPGWLAKLIQALKTIEKYFRLHSSLFFAIRVYFLPFERIFLPFECIFLGIYQMKFPLLAVTECLAKCLREMENLDESLETIRLLEDMRVHFNRAFSDFNDGGEDVVKPAEKYSRPDDRKYFGLVMIANELLRIRQDPNPTLEGGTLEKHMRAFMKRDHRTKEAKDFLKTELFRDGREFKKLNYGSLKELRAMAYTPFFTSAQMRGLNDEIHGGTSRPTEQYGSVSAARAAASAPQHNPQDVYAAVPRSGAAYQGVSDI